MKLNIPPANIEINLTEYFSLLKKATNLKDEDLNKVFDMGIENNCQKYPPELPKRILSEKFDLNTFNMYCRFSTAVFDSMIFDDKIKLELFYKNIVDFKIEDIHKIKEERKLQYLTSLTKLYEWTCFYPNKDVLNFFRKVGFSEDNLCWFISLESIKKETEKIIQRGNIVFFEGLAIMLIRSYLTIKIQNEIMIWGGEYHKKYKGNKFANTDFVNAKKRVNNKEVLEIEEDYKDSFDFLKTLFEQELIQETLLNFYKGDAAKVSFFVLTDLSLRFTKIKSKTRFYAEFFDLLYLVNGNLNVYSKVYRLLNLKDFRKAYGNVASYENYKGRRIINILTRGK